MMIIRNLTMVVSALAVLGLPLAGLAQAEDRQCDVAAVVYCGAFSPSELTFKIGHGDGRNGSDNLQKVLYQEGRGISADAIATSVDGTVSSDGTVKVGDRVVATGVWLAARDQPAGTTADGSLFLRPAAAVLGGATAGAFVSLSGDEFRWAILKRNGDVVRTPVASSTPTSTPTPTPATPTPVPTPAGTPTPVVQPTAGGTGADEPLPSTGPENVMGMVGLSGLGVAAGQYIRSRRSLKESLRRK